MSKLSVNVNSGDASSSPKKDTIVYEYNYPRIIVASVFLIILVAFGIWSTFPSPSESTSSVYDDVAASSPSNQPTESVTKPVTQVEPKAIEISDVPPVASPLTTESSLAVSTPEPNTDNNPEPFNASVSEANAAPTETTAPAETTAASEPINLAEQTVSEVSESVSTPVIEEAPETLQLAKADAVPAPSEPGRVNYQALDTMTDEQLIPGNIDIGYPRVKRAQLTWNVSQNEPSGTADPYVTLSTAEPSKKLMFFTQIDSMAGEHFFYEWKYERNVVARVKIDVGANRWRSHTYKTLSMNQLGDWRVSAVTADNKILATTTFKVTSE